MNNLIEAGETGLNTRISRRGLLKTAAALGVSAVVEQDEASASSNDLPHDIYEFTTEEGTFSSDYLDFAFSTKIKPEWINDDSPKFITTIQTNPPTWISPDPTLSEQSHEEVKKITFLAQPSPDTYHTRLEIYTITPQADQTANEYSLAVLEHIGKNGGREMANISPDLDNLQTVGHQVMANIPGNRPDEPFFEFEGTFIDLDEKIMCITLETTLNPKYFYDNVQAYWDAVYNLRKMT